ncbi:MAG: DUF3667 domain-containing protein [Patiriisocius sp.]|uniref:DUF3667 domain-containing protein n=1 Tax=Patiriisocius sp. TaxID=2822396 RepID=UPI003EF8E4F0
MSNTPNASGKEEPIKNLGESETPSNGVAETSSQEVEPKEKVSKKDEVSKNSRKHFKYRSNQCLNCGQPLDLSDRYCSYCSQLNSTKQLSFSDFFAEFFSSLVSYDSRLWFTLKDLLFKPGTITKNYVEGHRLRYANPFRFFLSVSIIYFLITGFLDFIIPNDSFESGKDDSGIVQYDVRETIDESEDETDTTDAYLNEETYVSNPDWENEVADAFNDTTKVATTVNNKQSPKISEENKRADFNKESIETDTIVAVSDKKAESKKLIPSYLTEEQIQKSDWTERAFKRFETYNDFYDYTEITNAGRALDSLKHPPTRFNLWLYEKNNVVKRVKEDPEKFISYLSGKVPFFLFFFAPLFALFFWLIYSKKKYSYMEHLVFIFHIFSFIFLSLLILAIPKAIFDTDIFTGILFLFIGPFYLYKALRNFYKQSRIITIIKFVFLNNVFIIAASIAAVFFFAITAATY